MADDRNNRTPLNSNLVGGTRVRGQLSWFFLLDGLSQPVSTEAQFVKRESYRLMKVRTAAMAAVQLVKKWLYKKPPTLGGIDTSKVTSGGLELSVCQSDLMTDYWQFSVWNIVSGLAVLLSIKTDSSQDSGWVLWVNPHNAKLPPQRLSASGKTTLSSFSQSTTYHNSELLCVVQLLSWQFTRLRLSAMG